MAFLTQPVGAVAGVTFATQPVVQVQDQYGNVVGSGSDSTVVVTLSLNAGTGTLHGALTKQAHWWRGGFF